MGDAFPMDIPDVVSLDNLLHNLITDKNSMEIFHANKIVAISDLILITVDLVQYILHLCTPGVIVLTTPEINLLVVDFLMDTVIICSLSQLSIIAVSIRMATTGRFISRVVNTITSGVHKCRM